MERISDYGTYTDGMRKSMTDKTWFLDKIDGAEEIVDYGCADGALLQYISDAMPNMFVLTGVDIDKRMLRLAQTNVKNAVFVTPEAFSEETELAKFMNSSACLNCGSVIHEVYSYGTPESIEKFWEFVFQSGFRYIAIRDMAMSRIDISAPNDVVDDALRKIGVYNYLNQDAQNRFNEFLSYIGATDKVRLDSWRDIVHYLLKYRYVTNWDREMRENYLPLLIEEVLLKIPSNYRVKYYEHYTLPYFRDKVLEDFIIDLKTKTHYKLLLERID